MRRSLGVLPQFLDLGRTIHSKVWIIIALCLISVSAELRAEGEESDFCKTKSKPLNLCVNHKAFTPLSIQPDRCRGMSQILTRNVGAVNQRHCKVVERIVPKMTRATLCREMKNANEIFGTIVTAPPCGAKDTTCLEQAASKIKKEIPALKHHWADLRRLEALYEYSTTLFLSAGGTYGRVPGNLKNGTTYKECNDAEKRTMIDTSTVLLQETRDIRAQIEKLMKKLEPRLKEMESRKEQFEAYADRTMQAACREGEIVPGAEESCAFIAATKNEVTAEPSTTATIISGLKDKLQGTWIDEKTGIGEKAIPADQIRDNPNICLEFQEQCRQGVLDAINENERLSPQAKAVLNKYFKNLEGEYIFMVADTRTADLLDQLDAAGEDKMKQFEAIATWTKDNAAFDALLTDKWSENRDLITGLIDSVGGDSRYKDRIAFAKGLLNHELLEKDPSLIIGFKNAAFDITSAGMDSEDPLDSLRAYKKYIVDNPALANAGYQILQDNEGLLKAALLEDIRNIGEDEANASLLGDVTGLRKGSYRDLASAYIQNSFKLEDLGKSLELAIPLMDKNADIGTVTTALEGLLKDEEFNKRVGGFLDGKSEVLSTDGKMVEVPNAELVGRVAKDLNGELKDIVARGEKWSALSEAERAELAPGERLSEREQKLLASLGQFRPTENEFALIDKVFEKPTKESLMGGLALIRNVANTDSAVERFAIAKDLYDSPFAKDNAALIDSVLDDNFQRFERIQTAYTSGKLPDGTPANLTDFEKGIGKFMKERGIGKSHLSLARALNESSTRVTKVQALDYSFRLMGGTKDGSPPADDYVIKILGEIAENDEFTKSVTSTVTGEKVFPAFKGAMKDSFAFYNSPAPGSDQTRFAALGLGEKQVELVGVMIDETTPIGLKTGVDALGSALKHRDDPIAMVKWAATVGDQGIFRKHEGLVRDAVDESLVNLGKAFEGGTSGTEVSPYYVQAKDYLEKNGITPADIALARKANQFFSGDEKVRGARIVAGMMEGDIGTSFDAMEQLASYERKAQFGRGADRDRLSGNGKLLDRTVTFASQDAATAAEVKDFIQRRFTHLKPGLEKAGLTPAQIEFAELGLRKGDPQQLRAGLAYADRVLNADRSRPYDAIGVVRDALDTPFMKDPKHAALAQQVMIDTIDQVDTAMKTPQADRTLLQRRLAEEMAKGKVTPQHLELAKTVLANTSPEGKVMAADIAFRLSGGRGYSGGKYFPNVNTEGFAGKEFTAAAITPEHVTVIRSILRDDVLPGDMAMQLVSDIVDDGNGSGDEVRVSMMGTLQRFAAKHPKEAKRVGEVLVGNHFEATRNVITFELMERARITDPGVYRAIAAATKEGASELVRNQEAAFYILGSRDLEEGYQRFKVAAVSDPEVVRRLVTSNIGSVQEYARVLQGEMKKAGPGDMDPRAYTIVMEGLRGLTTPANSIPATTAPAKVKDAPSGIGFLFQGLYLAGRGEHNQDHYVNYVKYRVLPPGASDADAQRLGKALYEHATTRHYFNDRDNDWRDTTFKVGGASYDLETLAFRATQLEETAVTGAGIPEFAYRQGLALAKLNGPQTDRRNSGFFSPANLQVLRDNEAAIRGYPALVDDPVAKAYLEEKLDGFYKVVGACQNGCTHSEIVALQGVNLPPRRITTSGATDARVTSTFAPRRAPDPILRGDRRPAAKHVVADPNWPGQVTTSPDPIPRPPIRLRKVVVDPNWPGQVTTAPLPRLRPEKAEPFSSTFLEDHGLVDGPGDQ